jgi:hypothetical protein
MPGASYGGLNSYASISATAWMKEREFTFDQWLNKVFTGRRPTWDWLYENALSPGRAEWLVTYPTQLFNEPELLIGRYSSRQLRRGFWSLSTSWELKDSIWSKELPWHLRRACIRSMVPLFERFFLHKPLQDTCNMWWDLLRYFGEDADERVVNEMYLALKKILFMDSLECQGAALHGLGHITHPGKQALIERYLRRHPDLHPNVRSYALASIEGKVL